MIEIKIPESIKIGGFDYSIESSHEHDRELKENRNYGECSHDMHRIRLATHLSGQRLSESFIHEFLHAADGAYNNFATKEDEIHGLAEGVLQVLEQLGIRFVR